MKKEKILLLASMLLAAAGCVYSIGMFVASIFGLFKVSADLQVSFLASSIACTSAGLVTMVALLVAQDIDELSDEILLLSKEFGMLRAFVQQPRERRPEPVYEPEETVVEEVYEPVYQPMERRRVSVAPPEQSYGHRRAMPKELPPVKVKKRPPVHNTDYYDYANYEGYAPMESEAPYPQQPQQYRPRQPQPRFQPQYQPFESEAFKFRPPSGLNPQQYQPRTQQYQPQGQQYQPQEQQYQQPLDSKQLSKFEDATHPQIQQMPVKRSPKLRWMAGNQQDFPTDVASDNGNEQVRIRPDKLPKLLQKPNPETPANRSPVDLEQRRRDRQMQRRMMSPFDEQIDQ